MGRRDGSQEGGGYVSCHDQECTLVRYIHIYSLTYGKLSSLKRPRFGQPERSPVSSAQSCRTLDLRSGRLSLLVTRNSFKQTENTLKLSQNPKP